MRVWAGRSIGKSTKNQTPLSMLTTTATTDRDSGGGGGDGGRGSCERDGQVCSSSRFNESICLSARPPFSERWWPGVTSSRAHTPAYVGTLPGVPRQSWQVKPSGVWTRRDCPRALALGVPGGAGRQVLEIAGPIARPSPAIGSVPQCPCAHKAHLWQWCSHLHGYPPLGTYRDPAARRALIRHVPRYRCTW